MFLPCAGRDNISVLLIFFTKGRTPPQSAEDITEGFGQSVARYSIRQGLGIVLSNPSLWTAAAPPPEAAPVQPVPVQPMPVKAVPGTAVVTRGVDPEPRRQTQV